MNSRNIWCAGQVAPDVKLSLLDRSRTRVGYAEGEALHHTVERAVRAEELGYHRLWTAEHHAVPGVATGAPAVLMAAAAARTSRIRIGSGGVMLPHHQPLVVAEQFLMLEGLHPGRIDLGLGRSLGFTPPVRRALRQESSELADFEADLRELSDYLSGTAEVTARPVTEQAPPMFLLATGQGISTAATLGLPVVVGGPVLQKPELAEMLRDYRRNFRPSPHAESPRVTVSLDIYFADTAEEAQELALPEIWAMARSRETGEFGPLEAPQDIRAQQWSRRTAERIEESAERTLAGPASAVEPQLEELIERTGAAEVMASASTYEIQALAEMDAALAELLLG
ncbi:MsnO8 family LLM class oxidoreductase [Nesterenkonia populi]